jgi:RNA polymerase sigma-70 factor, ECF subfamily
VAEAGRFVEMRPALFGIAYRMLGSAAEADDVVQEAYLRWAGVDESSVGSARGYLTTIVTRLSIDHLRAAKTRRETYRGPWLPEPVVFEDDEVPFPGADLADSLSMAFLGYDYAEIAATLDRSEPACRQVVSRAKRRIGDRRKRFEVDREKTRELTRRFVVACGTGDIDGLIALLAEDVVVWTDGGRQARAAPRPVVGPWRAARFLIHVAKTLPEGFELREVTLNGQPGIVFVEEGLVTNAVVVDVLDGRIAGIRVVSNPEKLLALRAGVSRPLA